MSLSRDDQVPALAEMVSVDAMELTFATMDEAGPDIDGHGVELLRCFLVISEAEERFTQRFRGQLIQWIAKWLLEVRTMVMYGWEEECNGGQGFGCGIWYVTVQGKARVVPSLMTS